MRPAHKFEESSRSLDLNPRFCGGSNPSTANVKFAYVRAARIPHQCVVSRCLDPRSRRFGRPGRSGDVRSDLLIFLFVLLLFFYLRMHGKRKKRSYRTFFFFIHDRQCLESRNNFRDQFGCMRNLSNYFQHMYFWFQRQVCILRFLKDDSLGLARSRDILQESRCMMRNISMKMLDLTREYFLVWCPSSIQWHSEYILAAGQGFFRRIFNIMKNRILDKKKHVSWTE